MVTIHNSGIFSPGIAQEHQAALQAQHAEIRAMADSERARLVESLRPATVQELGEAQASYDEAQAAHEAAVERLAAHDENKPRMLGNVTNWAKQRGALTDELAAYGAILEDRERRLGEAQRQHDTELRAAWSTRRNEIDRQGRADIDAANAALEAGRLALERQHAESIRLIWRVDGLRAMIDAIKPGA